MPKRAHYARIAITIPQVDLAAADRLAGAMDRSRSWIVAEAVRRYVAASEATVKPGVSAAAPDATTGMGLGESRLLQLIRDMSLTPEQRVRAAEETLRLTPTRDAGVRASRSFDRYEDFLDWQRTRDLIP